MKQCDTKSTQHLTRYQRIVLWSFRRELIKFTHTLFQIQHVRYTCSGAQVISKNTFQNLCFVKRRSQETSIVAAKSGQERSIEKQ